MRNTLFLSLALMTLVACGGAPPAAVTPGSETTPTPPAAAASDAKAPGEAKVGDRATCPVSGETLTVTDSSPKAEYEGKTYYFCCSGCEAKFKADPAKYLAKPTH